MFAMPVQSGIQNSVRHTGAGRYPEPCPSCRCRPVSSLYSFLVPGFRREDAEVIHYLFLDSG